MAGWIKMPLGMEVGLAARRLCVTYGPSFPSRERGQSPHNFRPVYFGHTAGWIKMTLGMEVGLGPGHIALDGDPAPPPKKGGRAP